jgi:hypothetical protein
MGSDTVVIAIIDTGVDTDHPDLVDNLWNNSGEIPGNFIDDDSNGKIDDIFGWDFTQNDADVNHEWNWHPNHAEDHGTHSAGIASRVSNNLIGIAGASQHSKIMTCKIFPSLPDAVAANAITYAADNGAHIIINSWEAVPGPIQFRVLYCMRAMSRALLFFLQPEMIDRPHSTIPEQMMVLFAWVPQIVQMVEPVFLIMDPVLTCVSMELESGVVLIPRIQPTIINMRSGMELPWQRL